MNTNIITEYSDIVRYFLNNRSFGSILIDEPIGWDEDDKEFTRNIEYHGIFTTLSKALSFYGDSKTFIETVFYVEGINAEIYLVKEEKNSQTDAWENVYSGTLDLSTLEIENGVLSVKFSSGGIESILKSKEGESIEIERTTTLDDKIIPNLIAEKIALNGRKVFLESTWKSVAMNYFKQLLVQTAATTGGTRYASNTFPFDISKKSHEQANSLYDGMDGNENEGQTTMMLLIPVDRQRTFSISINSLRFSGYSVHNSPVNNGHVSVSLVKYKNQGGLVRQSNSVIELWRKNFTGSNSIGSGTYTIPNSLHTITLEQGEALALEVMIRANFQANWGALGATFKRDYLYKLLDGSIVIQEDSVFNPTTCNSISVYGLANRLVEILTNKKNAVRSKELTTGKWRDLMVTHGFWIRGFSKQNDASLSEAKRKFKPLTTSFKDFITSLSAVGNLGLGIEKIGAREYVVIEDLKYFYNRNTTIRLPFQISNVKRSVDASNYFQSIEIGYEKGGEYEEAMGLDEFNTLNSYSTCIKRMDTKYSKISKYRADTYGLEFARRKPFFDYSTEDTSYDQDVFFIDCLPTKRGAFTKSVRLWQNDFTNEPTGIFSPETAYNLRLSPMNNLLRHGWVVNAGLTKYPNQKVKYTSSRGNSNLKTVYKENDDITNNELERARYEPEIIEFDHICTSDILKQLEGKTIVLGEEIRNCYGLIEFINEYGETEKGFLMSVKPNGAGRWKLLKYNN